MNANTTPRHDDDAQLRQLLSALMDGELDESQRATCLERACQDAEARRAWSLWHVAGDALRSSEVAALHSADFGERVAQRLAAEPAIVAPVVRRGPVRLVRRVVLPGAAAAAAVAVLSIVAVPMLRDDVTGGVEVARVQGASQPAAPMVPVVASVSRSTIAAPVLRRPSPVDAERFDLYLSAHSQMSGSLGLPRTSPYLRQGGSLPDGGR